MYYHNWRCLPYKRVGFIKRRYQLEQAGPLLKDVSFQGA